jgi:hypothetical protein
VHQEQAVPLGGEQVALHDRHAGRTTIDHLHEDAVRHSDDDDRDGPAVDTGFGVLDGVGDDLGRK